MAFNYTSLIAVFTAALAGSFHCTTMCGGIALSVTKPGLSHQIAYHVSRLVGYLSIGMIAGVLGETFFFSPQMKSVGVILGWCLALVLLISGLYILLGKSIHYQNRISSMIAKVLMQFGFRLPPFFRPIMVGFASVFLPCGWLYTFVLLSLATHSLIGGTATLFVFWLGTVPALVGGQVMLQRILKKLELSGHKLTGALMILAGIASLNLHFQVHHPSIGNSKEPILICH